MSTQITRISLATLTLVGLALAIMAGAVAPEREITLVASKMAFFQAGSNVPNPTIEVSPGRRIRLTFVNRDRGIEHDLSLPNLGLATPILPGDGSSRLLSFRAPDTPGEHEYTCQLHDRMMRGVLRVR